MTPQEFYDGPAQHILAEADRIMRPKMVDYATDLRFSSNFRRRAEESGLTAFQVWHVLAGKHWDAIVSFTKRGDTASEGIETRLADMINYCQLLWGLIEESNG